MLHRRDVYQDSSSIKSVIAIIVNLRVNVTREPKCMWLQQLFLIENVIDGGAQILADIGTDYRYEPTIECLFEAEAANIE